MQRRQRRLAAVAAAAMSALGLMATPSQAQFAGACCLPDKTCILVASPWECTRDDTGGIFLGFETTCTAHPCEDHYIPGVGMSQTAARRLTRQGVIHTLWTYKPIEVYKADHPMWTLHGQYGQIIAPHIWIDARDFPHADPETSAQNAADATLLAAGDALDAWEEAWELREMSPPAPFAWSLRIEALGQPFTWSLGEANGDIPAYSNHPLDVIDGRISSRQQIRLITGLVGGDDPGGYYFEVKNVTINGYNAYDFLGQFTEEFFTEPIPAKMTVGGQTVDIVGFNPGTRTFQLDDEFTGPLDQDAPFSIRRNDYEFGLRPCYFFKNGSAELSTWVEAYCDRLATATWPVGLPPPVAVIVPTEDVGEVTIDFANYLLYLQDDKAKGDVNGTGEDDGFTIDGDHNLEDWHNLYARDRSGNLLTTVAPDPLAWSPAPTGLDYGPYNEDLHSYIATTLATAYNHHREQSTWVHFRALWPRAILTQYIHGKGYGVTYDPGVDVREVPGGPGESGYHGVPGQWKESVNWDAYYCITSPWHSFQVGPDGGQRPVIYESAQTILATAAGGGAADEVPLLTSLPFDPDWYLPEGIPLFVEFTTTGPNVGIVYEVDGWDSGSQTLHLTDDLASTSINGHQFRVYYPFVAYFEYKVGGFKWPLIETFCTRYGEDVDETGFLATSKKWAAEQARAQTYALPENPYTLTIGPGQVPGWYDGLNESVSRVSVFPHEPFTSQDGWLNGTDWAEVASQARDHGVNHFDWFVPNLVINTAPSGQPEVWEPSAVMDEVMMAIYMMTGIGDPYIYHNIACIADWDKSGMITEADATAFMNALSYEVIEADLNNDGLWDEGDEAIFNAAFCIGDCAPIDDPGCSGTGPGTCEDADWCNDGTVAVADIFCFIASWLANDYDARNYGGTEGVPALFAWLGNWFAWGIGPCDP